MADDIHQDLPGSTEQDGDARQPKPTTSSITRRGALGLGATVALLALAGCGKGSDGSQDSTAEDAGDSSTSDTSATDEEAQIEEALQNLTTEQKVCQLFCVRPESLVDVTMTAAGDKTRSALEKHPVGGICFFAQNLEDPDQTTEMLTNVKQFSTDICGLPMLCAVDEEGGTVARVASNSAFGVEDVGDMRDIGDAGDTDKAKDAAVTVGTYLTNLGFTMDFAPDADVCNNPESDTMARRSFGTSSDVVAPMVKAQVEGYLSTGIGCCAKHFPGIGGATGDSESEPIVSEKTADEMAEEELVPFQSAIEAGVPMIMVGHLSCPNITGDSTPASLSKDIVTDMLRNRLGFDGVIITDSIGMGAISANYTTEQATLAALNAGVDMVLMPADFDAAYAAVIDAVNAGDITEDRLDDSVRRIIRMKRQLNG